MIVCSIICPIGCLVLQLPGCRYGWMSGWLVSRLSQRCNRVWVPIGIILRAKWLSYGIMWPIGLLCCNRFRFLPLRHESVGVAGGFPSGYRPLSPKALFPTGGENVCSPEHSKLCFLQHASASAAKNACPCRGRNLAPKSQIVRMGHNGGTATDGQVSPFNDSKHE